MEKRIRIIVLWLFLVMALFAAQNYNKQLEVYDKQMQGASNDELLRVFHGLKGIYIQSIIAGNEPLKEETLKRLIKSAGILKIDSSRYASELSNMQKQERNKVEHKVDTTTIEPGVFKNKNTQSIKEEVSAKRSLPSSFKGKNVLQDIRSENEGLILDFGMPLSDAKIKVFGLNSTNSYKKVIDIPAIILGSPPSVNIPPNLQNIRINQYNSDTIRIVLDAPKVFDAYVSVIDNQVLLSFSKKPPLLPKSTTKEAHAAPTLPPPPPPVPLLAKKEPIRIKSKTIVIDAGHGGKDAGAVGYEKLMEKHLVLDIALQLGKELKQKGHKVYYTRTKDVFINLRARTKVANDKNADLFISLHANAAPTEAKKLTMKGVETFFLSPDRSERSKNVAALENQSDIEEMDFYSKETFLNVFNREKIVLSNKAAIDIQSHMLKALKAKHAVDDGGVREAPFWVLVGATMPSVLIEVGYISNPEEAVRLFSPYYQKLLVAGISDGIEQYFSNNP